MEFIVNIIYRPFATLILILFADEVIEITMKASNLRVSYRHLRFKEYSLRQY